MTQRFWVVAWYDQIGHRNESVYENYGEALARYRYLVSLSRNSTIRFVLKPKQKTIFDFIQEDQQ